MIATLGLETEHAVNPLGLDVAQPRFSWRLRSSERGQMQSAYRVLVASSELQLGADTGDKWDSGRVASDRSVSVSYEGSSLASGEKCWWKARVWDRDGQPSAWSETATFEMGLLSEGDWQGGWIAADASVSAPLLRKGFDVAKEVARARAYVCGLGYHELYLNGSKVGDHVLDPATTYYDNVHSLHIDSRVLYVTHDVSHLLSLGRNTVGIMLGHGWYSSDDGHPEGRMPYAERPVAILQMNVEFVDGGRMSIATDGTWRCASGPITANDFAKGEAYDARLEQPGWSTAEYDDVDWQDVAVVQAPSGCLAAQTVEPIKVIQRIAPVRLFQLRDDAYIFDMGQFISGWVELRAKGPRGTVVTLRHAGRLNVDIGSLDDRNNVSYGVADQTDTYVLKGKGLEVWHPRFVLHGFRYVEVIGYPGEPTLDALEGQVVHSSVPTVGEFSCSNSLLNRIHQNVCWTFKGSFQGIPQDAADRAERVGWLGDPAFVAEDYLSNYGSFRFWAKWLDDIADAQKPDGEVPYVCPIHWGAKSYREWPTWQSTYTMFVWYLYQYYGDERILSRHYEGVKRQVEYFRARAEGSIMHKGLGDHMEPRDDGTSSFRPMRTPEPLCETAYYYLPTRILAEAAQVLGHTDDAAAYAELATGIRDAFNREFLDPETNQYATGSQTSNALALYLDLVPQGRESYVLENLVDDIVNRHGGHLSTGIIGANALEQALPRYGRADVMYGIATKTTFPSWGYGVVNGATTVWEDYEGSSNRSVSMKMQCSTEKFFYHDLAGIGPASPGYKRITIKPHVVGDLGSASASMRTVMGLASSSWVRDAQSITLDVTIPVNSSAKVSVPVMGLAGVTIRERGDLVWEDGSYVSGVAGIRDGSDSADYVTFDVGSGSYRFQLRGTPA
jgi:alpha-L-rhamnosidase